MGTLDELGEKVKALLEKALTPPVEVSLSTGNGLVVFVTSPRFEGMDDMDRQNLVWDELERALDSEERRAVAIVVALTPKERVFHLAGS